MNPNYYEKQKKRAHIRKMELVESMGGKCCRCGYDKNYAALEFHHINPEEKSFQLDARRIANTSKELLLEEAKKCLLLCSNCHHELHNPDCGKDNVDEEYKNFDKKFSIYRGKRETICPVCGKAFDYVKGKLYCSKECREKDKNYPPKEEVVRKYSELKSQQKVADYFGLTRKIIINILKK